MIYYSNPTGYAYAGFYKFQNGGAGVVPLLPFADNNRYRNFVFSLSDIDSSGRMTTGAGGNYGEYPYELTLDDPPTYQFQPPATNWTTLPALLATNQTQWLGSYPLDSPQFLTYPNPTVGGYLGEIGISAVIDWNQLILTYTMASNARNIYGLPFLSAELAWGNTISAMTTLSAGNSTIQDDVRYYLYPETAQPQFQPVEYDFWSIPHFTYPPSNLLPGMPDFSPTNQGQLMIATVGDPYFQVAGYAKLAVLNGYPGVYGYLGQYFTNAYEVDTNGIATANTTGVLSPYGQFFATEPGPAALVTMPDIDTGAQGTCTVYAVSLALDKNHDGAMDTSFNGSDATSQASPMECWVNNGYIKPGSNGNLDQDLPLPLNNPNNANYSAGQITCPRDLENFFRLWICGVPSLPLSQNYTFTMSMSPSSGNPAVNLYWSCETNGGTGYLTDTNIAAQQIANGYGVSLGTVSNNCPCTIPSIAFGFGGTQHFLFEGAGIGSGELVLTISQNGNVIVQTGVWLDLHDIKDFYERAAIADNTSGAISNWSSTIESSQPAIANLCGNDTNLIVFVHGINVKNWAWLDDSDTVLKRLYWAGYQGKFATVDWPCNFFDWSLLLTQTSVFNQSEVKAYKASTALATYLNQLSSRFAGYRLNLYVHSQGNAVVSEAIEQSGVQFDTYILTQGAMPDSAYDVSAPTDSTLLGWESAPGYHTPEWQPMGYHGIYTNFTGNIVNFYNTNDPVLKWWLTDQEARQTRRIH